MLYTLVLAFLELIQLLVHMSKADGKSYVLNTLASVLIGFSWILMHNYLSSKSSNSVYVDHSLSLLYVIAVSIDIAMTYTRVMIVAFPDSRG